MSGPTCAAITLAERGGGVAAVARLVWGAFERRWPSSARLITLEDDQPPVGGSADVLARMRFGSRLAAAQALGESAWVFYTHVALAQVQPFVPPGLRRPYAIFLHGIEIWRPLTARQRVVLQGARLLVANSRYTADRASALHAWLPPVAVCTLALPDERVGAQSPPRTQPPTVLVVGRMAVSERYKGHDQLIEAWPEVARRVPGARLVVVGDGDDRSRLENEVRRRGMAHAVEFTGFVTADRLDALYGSADVFAMPSRNEGFGLVYLEAMRHGLPCIGSNRDAAAELISDGTTGLLVDPDDVSALSASLVRLLTDPGLRDAMGRAARARSVERFSRVAFDRRLMALVDAAFGRDGRVGSVADPGSSDATAGAR